MDRMNNVLGRKGGIGESSLSNSVSLPHVTLQTSPEAL